MSYSVLNIKNFIFKSTVATTDMFLNCNQSMIYCINEYNTPDNVKNQLINYPNLYCSDTCYKNEDNKIIPCENSCIDDCQNDDKYKFEYDGTCYRFDMPNDKCDILEYLNDLILTTEKSQSYIIKGGDSTIFITPLSAKIENSTVNIDFSECEKKLKESNQEKEYRMLQMNIDNKEGNNLVDQVEYKIYDKNNEEVDLSICDNVKILIEYKINNISMLRLNEASNFLEMGIDVFNIKDKFFNDICYPYTDKRTSSDMILKDRVSDIFQNVSLCGEGCEYQSFNFEKNSSTCLCDIKKVINTKPEIGNFQNYIMSTFLESNFGVIKCYKLVFTLKGNLSNIGFWVFGIMLIIHIPIYILNYIIGTKNITKFISEEMAYKGYTIENDIGEQKMTKSRVGEKESEKNNNLNLIKYNADNYKNNFILTAEGSNNNPPKRRISYINTSAKRNPQKLKTKKRNNNAQIYRIYKINLNEHRNKKEIKNNAKRNTYTYGYNNNLNLATLAINSNENLNNNSIKIEEINESNVSNEIEIKQKKINRHPLILINANNETNPVPFKSDYVINNFDYDEAIIYEDRSYCRIFFILLIAKENVLNMIFFNPPLEFKPLRIAILIFSFACDYALNALFYLSDNISDKYHYEGLYRELFCIINNLTISISSTIVSSALLFFFKTLTQSTEKIENLFREQEELLKKDSNYKVNKESIMNIRNNIKDIIKCLKIKVIIFVILEFLVLFFFFYYVTAFCSVYRNTQVSWILDCIVSYIFSLGIALGLSMIFAIIYKIAVKYKIKSLYRLVMILFV